MSDTLDSSMFGRVYGGKLVPTLNGGLGVELLIQLHDSSASSLRFTELRLPDGRVIPIESLEPTAESTRETAPSSTNVVTQENTSDLPDDTE